MNKRGQNKPTQLQDPRSQSRTPMQESYLYEQEQNAPKKGRGFKVAIVIEIILLIALIAGAALLVLSNQPNNTDKTSEIEETNINNELVINDKMMTNESPQTSNEKPAETASMQMPVDKIILPYEDEEISVRTPGKIALSQIIGTERIAVEEVDDALPNTEIDINESSDKLVQNGTYEVRMEEPIVLEDGRRLSFHAYIIDYRWERSEYLHNMEPSEHKLYVLADNEDPDVAELIQSGVAARTKNDTISKADQIVELDKNKNGNTNVNSNSNSNSNANNVNTNTNSNTATNETTDSNVVNVNENTVAANENNRQTWNS